MLLPLSYRPIRGCSIGYIYNIKYHIANQKEYYPMKLGESQSRFLKTTEKPAVCKSSKRQNKINTTEH